MNTSDAATLATATQIVDEAITSRRSVRAFTQQPVARADIEAILQIAARAPSGVNAQPWKVHVLTGASLQRVGERIVAAFLDPTVAAQHKEEYDYYPDKWVSPYIDRRRKVGWDLYSRLGIDKSDRARMQAQHARNYRFFDAPVGLFFTIDRVMGKGSWLDYGMFLENIMLAARARQLDTCPQAAFTQFHRLIQAELDYPDTEMLVCGMSLGYADPAAIENSLVTERAPVSSFTHFHD